MKRAGLTPLVRPLRQGTAPLTSRLIVMIIVIMVIHNDNTAERPATAHLTLMFFII